MKPKTYIDGFTYILGENSYDIKELEELKDNKEASYKLIESGIVNYKTTKNSPFDFAFKVVKDFFKKNIIKPKNIDAVMFSTNSFWKYNDFNEYDVSNFLISLELEKSFPILSSFSFCGNFLSSIRTASQYIQNGTYNNILVVLSDQLDNNVTRIIPPNLSVASDAATCCLVSSMKLNYSIDSISQTINANLCKLDPNLDFPLYMQGVAEGVIENISATLNEAKVDKEDISIVIPNNYNNFVTPSMARLVGIEKDKVFMDNIPRFAHAGPSDIGINLTDYLEKIDQIKEENILLLSTGPMLWGSAIVRRENNG